MVCSKVPEKLGILETLSSSLLADIFVFFFFVFAVGTLIPRQNRHQRPIRSRFYEQYRTLGVTGNMYRLNVGLGGQSGLFTLWLPVTLSMDALALPYLVAVDAVKFCSIDGICCV